MPSFRIFRLRENPSQHFRWVPHVSGVTQIKRKDYNEGGRIEAPNEYAAWSALRDTDDALKVGDVLESEAGQLSVCKYVGFDRAEWIVPDVKTGLEAAPAESGPAAPA